MFKKLLFTFFLFLSSSQLFAQYTSFTGTVLDNENKPIAQSTVKLVSKAGNKTVVADNDGKYVFKNINTFNFSLVYSAIGFKTKTIKQKVSPSISNFIKLPNVYLEEEQYSLNEVTISAKRKKIDVKPDTIQFNVEHLTSSKNQSAIDLLKQLPSSMITSSGNYRLYGQEITKIRVNGKEYMDSDLKTISTIIPSNLIDNIQLVNDYGEIANLSNNKSLNPERVLNINLKEDIEKGFFGHIQAGIGTDGRYTGDMALNLQRKKQELGLIGNINNTNLSKGNGSFGGLTDNSDGENIGKVIGLNYRNDFNKKSKVYLNYNFSDNQNNSIYDIYRESLFPNATIINNEKRINTNENKNHHATVNFEYKPTANDYIKITPDIEFSESRNNGSGIITSSNEDINTTFETNSKVSNNSNKIGGNIIYNHRFGNSGRNITTSFNGSRRKEETYKDIFTDQSINSDIPVNQKTTNNTVFSNFNFNLNFTEPLSKSSNLDLNYSLNVNENQSEVNTLLFDVDDRIVSRDLNLNDNFLNKFTTNTLTSGYRLQTTDINFFVGGNVINTTLKGESQSTNNNTSYSETSLVPTLRFNYNVGSANTIGLDYKGTPSAPTLNQLLPINDIQNVQNVIIGNPNLKQEFRNDLKVHFNRINIETGYSLFLGVDFNSTANKIIQSRLIDNNSLAQRTTYINVDGYKSLRFSWSLTVPLKDKKQLLVLTGSSDKSNNINEVNEVISKGSNWLGTQQIQYKTTISKKLENQLNLDFNISKSLYPENNFSASMKTLRIGANGTYKPIQNLSIGYDLNKTFNSGFNGISMPSPLLINLYLEQAFLKHNNFNVRLTVLDILNQNASILTDTFANTVSNTHTNRIKRYFLISLKYNFQKINFRK